MGEAGSREGLRAAAQAVVDAWVDDESGMETFDPTLIDALAEALGRAALGDTQEPRPDPLDVERLARALHEVSDPGLQYANPEKFWRGIAEKVVAVYAAASPAAPTGDFVCSMCGQWSSNGIHDGTDGSHLPAPAAPETREPTP